MFACFTGLRYSDMYKLTWGELSSTPKAQVEQNKKGEGMQ
jgi:hypothetical protein